jgi:hypothetical protein
MRRRHTRLISIIARPLTAGSLTLSAVQQKENTPLVQMKLLLNQCEHRRDLLGIPHAGIAGHFPAVFSDGSEALSAVLCEIHLKRRSIQSQWCHGASSYR